MSKKDKSTGHLDELAAVATCSRILNDVILQLASRYGVEAVVSALTEIMDCQSCGDRRGRAFAKSPARETLVTDPVSSE